MPALPPESSVVLPTPENGERARLTRLGFRALGPQMLRVDMVERLARHAHEARAGKQPSVVDYGRLDQRLNRLMEEGDMVGLAVGVVEGGQIRFLKGYGETLEGSGQPVNAATLFRWASVSNGVAGEMVAKLADLI